MRHICHREDQRTLTGKAFFVVSVGICLNIFIIVTALAAVEGGHGEHAFTWKDWLWPVVNFALLVTILVVFGRKPLREYFRKRTEVIEKSLQEARESKELAKKALEEVRERLRNTDQEIDKILEDARKSGEREKSEIIAEGVRMKEKILEQAKANIDIELQKAKEKIKSEAALAALELAEKQLKEKLGRKDQEDLINDYIRKLEARN